MPLKRRSLYACINERVACLGVKGTMIFKREAMLADKKVVRQFIAYLFVGGIAFLINTAILLLVRDNAIGAGYSIQMADAAGGIAGFIVGLIVNYYLSLLFVFKAKSSTKDFVIVLIIGAIGLFMTTGGLVLLNAYMGIPILIAQCIITGTVFFWNFIARKMMVYKDK